MNHNERRTTGKWLLSNSVARDMEIIRRDIELEQAAIDEYTGQLETASPAVKKVLEHLIKEETEHKQELMELLEK
jgi:rubrerythrin